MKRSLCVLVFLAMVVGVADAARAGVVLDGGGLVLAEQGGTFDASNLAEGASPFALDEYGAVHFIPNLNDLTYGNTNSWLGGGATGTSGPFAGISLGGTTTTVQSIAFGRDNGGEANQFTDRWAGLYTLQYTQVANPSATTPDESWAAIGTLDYQSAGGAGFSEPWLRHRYNFDPVEATGIRLVLSDAATAIDEIELYAAPGTVYEYEPVMLTPEAGFSITWDENEGDFFDPSAPPQQVGAPDNVALAANGAVAFGNSAYPSPAHAIAHANDGYYGNSNSWLQDLIPPPDPPDPNPFIGIDFAGTDPVAIENIAFGRDNGNNNPPGTDPGPGGVLMDRWQGLYTLQYTLLPDPDELTMETGDAATGWANIGTIELAYPGEGEEPAQEPWLRHLFDVAADDKGPILATGIRIVAPMINCIDEIEVNTARLHDLIWDVPGHADLTWEGGSNWTPGGGPPGNLTKATIPSENTDTITVGTTTATAYSLAVDAGKVAILAGQKLSVTAEASFASGTTLELGNGATFSARGGTIDVLSTAGDAAVEVGVGTLTVAELDNTSPGSLTKQGSGTLSLSGDNPLEGYSPLILAGGTLNVDFWKNGAIIDELSMTPSWLDPADLHYPGFTGGAVDEPLPGDGVYHGPLYTILAETPPELSFTMTPGFVGTDVIVDTSWGVSFNHSIDVDYFFDPDGPGPEAEIPLVENIMQTRWNDQSVDITQEEGQDWSGYLELGSGLELTADSQFRVTGTLAGGAYPEALTSSVWRFMYPTGVPEVLDLSGVDVEVAADSTVRLMTIENSVLLGSLTLESGIFTNTGVVVSFAGGTTIDAAADATVGVDLQADIDLGQINVVNPTPVTFVKSGPLDLVMTSVNVGTGFENVTFDVQEDRLIGVHGSNPFDGAALQMGGGDLVLSSGGGSVAYDNALTVTQSGTLTAGAAGGGVAEELTVTLGSTPDNGVSIDAGRTLTLQTTDGYALEIAGPVSGPEASLYVAQGNVALASEVNVLSLRVAQGAVVGTGADQVLTIGGRLSLGTTSLSIDEENTFSVTGTDLTVGGSVAVSGGVLTMTNSAAPPPITVPPEALALTGSIQLVEEGGGFGGFNLADPSTGAVPFAGDALVAPHTIAGLNDVNYGNSYSWIGAEGAAPIAGISLGETPIAVGSIAFGRDNAGSHPAGGSYTDRHLGLYTLQFTQAPNPDVNTGDENWFTIGTLEYLAADGEGFAEPYLRHRYVFDPVEATGIRLLVPGTGWNGLTGTCIDEIELYGRTLAPIDMPLTNFEVTASSTFNLDTDTDAMLGDLALGTGVELTISGAPVNVKDLNAGDGAIIEGDMVVRGIINTGASPGTLTIRGGLEMDEEEAGYDADLHGKTADLVMIENADAVLGGTLTLQGTLPLLDPSQETSSSVWGDQSRRIVQAGEIGGENYLEGEFFPVVTAYQKKGPDEPAKETYMGAGMWLNGVSYLDFVWDGQQFVPVPVDPTAALYQAIDVSVFQAKAGDCNGDRSISFADFNDLANNYTGALAPGAGGKEWRQGDFNSDADVDFGDFNDLANNYTGAGVEYGPGGPAGGAKAAPGEASLIIYLANTTDADGVPHAAGDVVLAVEGASGGRINGYEVYSAAGLLVPDADDAPYPLVGGAYMEDSTTAIVAFSGVTSPLSVSGNQEFTLGWEFDVQAKAAGDLEFSYGTAAGVVSGNVLYVVPEPGSLLLLACGALGLLLWRRRRAA